MTHRYHLEGSLHTSLAHDEGLLPVMFIFSGSSDHNHRSGSLSFIIALSLLSCGFPVVFLWFSCGFPVTSCLGHAELSPNMAES